MGDACAKREARIEREELVTPGWLTSLPLSGKEMKRTTIKFLFQINMIHEKNGSVLIG